MAAERPSVNLLQGDTPEWKLWSLVAELASRIDPDSWVLIGGQMVALHLHLAGEMPRRTTTDVDIVADVMTKRGSFQACKTAARGMGLDAEPSITGKFLHRFSGPAGQLDLMVADHLPDRLMRQFTKPVPVPVPGGQRALDRRMVVDIHTEFGPASIPLPDLVGALVVKARAATSDTRDRNRHYTDLAQLASIVEDPLTILDHLDKKERKYLRRARLANDPTGSPWLELTERTRQRAIDAWFILVES